MFIIDLVCLGVVIFLSLRIWGQTEKFIKRDITSTTMDWPLWPLLAILTGLLILTSLLFALKIAMGFAGRDMSNG